MSDRIEFDKITQSLGNLKETTSRMVESNVERDSRLKREEWDAISGHVLRAVAIMVYLMMFGLCAFHFLHPEFGEWARVGAMSMATGLIGYTVGQRTR